MTAKLYIFAVSHPEYGEATVTARDKYDAVVAAACGWGVRWTGIAKDCRIDRLGPARKPRCKRCGEEFGAPGTPEGYCSDCARAMEIAKRQIQAIKTPDRRAGTRGRRT